MAGDSSHQPRPERGQLLWSIFLNAIVAVAIVSSIIPIALLVHGFFNLVTRSQALSGADILPYAFPFTGLCPVAIFSTHPLNATPRPALFHPPPRVLATP